MTPNIGKSRIETIQEEEETTHFEESEVGLPLGDLLEKLNKDGGGSLQAEEQEDDMSSIGMTSTFDHSCSKMNAQAGPASVGGSSTLASNSVSPSQQEQQEQKPQTKVKFSKAKLKKWVQRRRTQGWIVLVGSLCQILWGTSHHGLKDTFQVLVSAPQVPLDSEGSDGHDRALAKFHHQFAAPVLAEGAHQLQTTFHMMHSFAAMIRKMSQHTDQAWPYVHISEFQQRTEALLKHHRGTGTLIIQQVALAPLVPKAEHASFHKFQAQHVDDNSRYQHQAKDYSPVPRASRELANNAGNLEYHSFVPFQEYWPKNQQNQQSQHNQAAWFQRDHVKAALNTIQKTEAPVLLLARNSDSSDYILQPILENVLVRNRLFRKNVHETQVVAVLAAQVKFVHAVQQSMQQHFHSLGLSTRNLEATTMHVSLKDSCNLQVSYQVTQPTADNTTQPALFLGLGTYHTADWGTASRQVQWNEEATNHQSSSTTGTTTASGTPFCFPDGLEIAIHPSQELHDALSHHFESKFYLFATMVLKLLLTLLMVLTQGFLCLLMFEVVTVYSMQAWRKLVALLDEPDMETMVAHAMVKEVNHQLARKDSVASTSSSQDNKNNKKPPQWESMDTSITSRSGGSGSKAKSKASAGKANNKSKSTKSTAGVSNKWKAAGIGCTNNINSSSVKIPKE